MKAKSLIIKLITLAAVIYGMFTITEGIMTLTKFTTLAYSNILRASDRCSSLEELFASQIKTMYCYFEMKGS